MKLRKFYYLSAIVLASISCQNEYDNNMASSGEVVTFLGSIAGTVDSRATNSKWDSKDAIGVYMLTANSSMVNGSLEENKKYVTQDGDGRFFPAEVSEGIYCPPDGSMVDFIAYYPYTKTITDYKYSVDILDQTSQGAIDLLYSSNVKGLTKDEPRANMEFAHQFSKIILNTNDLTKEGLNGMSVTISDVQTKAFFNLSDASLEIDQTQRADVNMKVTTDGNEAIIEAILLPTKEGRDYELIFSIPAGKSKRSIILENTKFDAGKKYIYNVEITDNVKLINKGSILDWTEVPAGDLIVDKGSYPQDIPLVYNKENMGEGFPLPSFPSADEAPSVSILTDPFAWSDGSGRVKYFSEWEKRRSEIIAEVGYYEMGMRPGKPESLSATYENNNITVLMNHNGKSLTADFSIKIPDGEGPFPVVIGTSSSPTGPFDNCILINLNPYQFGDQNNRTTKFWSLYPELADAGGDYMAWTWGVSRLIDGLELVKDQIGADMEHIGIIGCSWAGKLALFGGAFDERIALTMAQESGGGGINSWRVSDQAVLDNIENGDSDTEVERINNTNYSWFMPALKENFMGRPDKLPYDHHEIIALIAPRALLIYGNPSYSWMCDRSGFASTMAAMEVWKSMGIEDRYGYDFSDGHFHCMMTESQTQATELFVDKFLRGINTPTQTIRKAPDSKYMYGLSADTFSWFKDWEGHSLR